MPKFSSDRHSTAQGNPTYHSTNNFHNPSIFRQLKFVLSEGLSESTINWLQPRTRGYKAQRLRTATSLIPESELSTISFSCLHPRVRSCSPSMGLIKGGAVVSFDGGPLPRARFYSPPVNQGRRVLSLSTACTASGHTGL